ncbi:MAG TPA: hypothetical protein VF428_02135 [Casimicrobiaceae bacterium]
MRSLFKHLLRAGMVAALGICASAASAAPAAPAVTTCAGGELAPGVYGRLVVTGTCTVKGDVTVNGNVTITDGADLDAAYAATQLTINGDVSVGKGAKLGLGCAFFYHDCGFPPTPSWPGSVTVNGNIVANQALTMYIDFTTVHGNIVVNGGGDLSQVDHPPAEDGLVLPIKDNQVDGNIVVHGWQGAWFGIIRNSVGGNVMASHTEGTRLGDDGTLDSTEIATNVIGGNLICVQNMPSAQIGDSHGSPNTVGGNKIGECAGL